jgi:YidC/Oxa1 family membrane protein insertase
MDNKRLILASVFVFSLFMLWDAWQKFNASPAARTSGSGRRADQKVAGSTSSECASPRKRRNPLCRWHRYPPVTAGVKSSRSRPIFLSPVFRPGGDLVSLELNHYKSVTDKTQPFLLFEGKHQYAAQSGLIGEGLPNHRTLYTAVKGERELTSDAKEIKLRLEAINAEGVKVAKVFTFTRGSYLIGVSHEIDNASQKPIAAHAYYQLQRDTSSPEGESGMANTFTGPALYTEQDKYQKLDFKDIEKGKAKFSEKADNGWMAMVQHYFVSAWIPEAKTGA